MVKLHVTGMACDGCAKAVERVIKAQDPHASVKVDLGSGRVEAETSAAPVALVAAIEAVGYGAKPALRGLRASSDRPTPTRRLHGNTYKL